VWRAYDRDDAFTTAWCVRFLRQTGGTNP
jgi:hypothetical protein